MTREFPCWLGPAVTALEGAIRAEDEAHWGRAPRDPGPLVFGWYVDRGWPAGCADRIVLHWSAETPVGPRDSDTDVRRRLDNVVRLFVQRVGFVHDVDACTGDTCGTMQLSFVPVVAS